jgi:hypothetical protein
MTQTSIISQDVRRHPDGSIDSDFYRTRATALRGRSTRDASTWTAACAFVLTTVSAIIVAVLLAAAPAHPPNGGGAAALTAGHGNRLIQEN